MEERRQLEAENRELLAQAMQEQKAKLEADTDAEVKALMSRYAEQVGGEAMHKLEEQLIQAEKHKKMSELELSETKQNAAAKLRAMQVAHTRAMHEHKTVELRMFRAALAGFEEERHIFHTRIHRMASQLSAASDDIEMLAKSNTELADTILQLGGRLPIE
jgi:hypothetical protein